MDSLYIRHAALRLVGRGLEVSALLIRARLMLTNKLDAASVRRSDNIRVLNFDTPQKRGFAPYVRFTHAKIRFVNVSLSSDYRL